MPVCGRVTPLGEWVTSPCALTGIFGVVANSCRSEIPIYRVAWVDRTTISNRKKCVVVGGLAVIVHSTLVLAADPKAFQNHEVYRYGHEASE